MEDRQVVTSLSVITATSEGSNAGSEGIDIFFTKVQLNHDAKTRQFVLIQSAHLFFALHFLWRFCALLSPLLNTSSIFRISNQELNPWLLAKTQTLHIIIRFKHLSSKFTSFIKYLAQNHRPSDDNTVLANILTWIYKKFSFTND